MKSLISIVKGIYFAEHIVKTDKTLRETAKIFDCHHSTIYRAIEQIKDERPRLYKRIHEIYEDHKKDSRKSLIN